MTTNVVIGQVKTSVTVADQSQKLNVLTSTGSYHREVNAAGHSSTQTTFLMQSLITCQ